jgi:hypothetical protein
LDKIVKPEPDDKTDLFFKTMAATVKKFTPDLASDAKKKIFNTVMDLEAINRRPSRLSGNISMIDYDSSSHSQPL